MHEARPTTDSAPGAVATAFEPLELARRPAEALAAGVLAWPLTTSTPLRLTGPDRIPFLHGQVSNDVRGLPVGGAARALLLNHKGHALADMTVCRRGEDLFVTVADGAGPLVADALRRHIVFDQVEIENLAGVLVAVSLQGGGVDGLLTAFGVAPPAQGGFVETELAGARALLHAARRSTQGGYDLHLLAGDLASVVAALAEAGAQRAEPAAVDLLRVLAGEPGAATEAGAGVLPQEAGLEPAVSYAKGCYLGQEIMARIEARGRLKRGLARLLLAGLPQAQERQLVSGGRSVGRLGTVATTSGGRALALAVLRRDVDEAAHLEVGGTPVLALEWLA